MKHLPIMLLAVLCTGSMALAQSGRTARVLEAEQVPVVEDTELQDSPVADELQGDAEARLPGRPGEAAVDVPSVDVPQEVQLPAAEEP